MRESFENLIQTDIDECRWEYPELVNAFESECREFSDSHAGDTPRDWRQAQIDWGELKARHYADILTVETGRGYRVFSKMGRTRFRRQ